MTVGWVSDPNGWVGLLTLASLEIVLGVDNIIFISILAGTLPPALQPRARKLGLFGAFFTRILLLLSIAWIVKLTRPLFSVFSHGISGRDLILIVGGLFLIAKATYEIHNKLEGEEHGSEHRRAMRSLTAVVAQIMVVDIVFSLDSVITAVGMADDISLMITANVIALALMLVAAGPDQRVRRSSPDREDARAVLPRPDRHQPHGRRVRLSRAQGGSYTNFAMGFSVVVEMLNLRLRKKSEKAVKLHARDYESLSS